MQTFSVSEITGYIRELFDVDRVLADVWVQGEVSNLTKARSGHWYFTIKDASAQLRCVMFRGAARRLRIAVAAGDEILAHGRVSIYEARGEYQLYVEHIETIGGLGDLHRQFEALKAKLDAEGLFDPRRMRPLGTIYKRCCVGVFPWSKSFCIRHLCKARARRRRLCGRWSGSTAVPISMRSSSRAVAARWRTFGASTTKLWRGQWRIAAFR